VMKNANKQHGEGNKYPHEQFDHPTDQKKIDPPKSGMFFSMGIGDNLN